MNHLSLMDMLPDEESMVPEQGKRASTQERMGLAEGRCAQCRTKFEYFPAYHKYRIDQGRKALVFCSYGCMRTKEREIMARKNARRRERALQNIARCEEKMREPGWEKLARSKQESVRQMLERAKEALEDTTC